MSLSFVEPLENRTLLSGNVTATLAGTTLVLLGDDLANGIKIWSGSRPNQVLVRGENDTRVNGTRETWVFEEVQGIDARLAGGNDSFKSANLVLGPDESAPDFDYGLLSIDGGTGDDRIEVKNTTLRSATTVSVSILGDTVDRHTEPTSGNDTIELSDTRIIAGGPGVSQADASVTIIGDYNTGGVITGGNDRITVSNTTVSAMGEFFDNASVSIVGDWNVPAGAFDMAVLEGVVGEGNDVISVSDTVISTAGQFVNSSLLDIQGDYNVAWPPSWGGHRVARIGGGNDTISVKNTTLSATRGEWSNSSTAYIRGDWNTAFLPADVVGSATATIGGGNDSISVDDVDVIATGTAVSDSAFVYVFGDENSGQNDGPAGSLLGTAAATITGNDVISVRNIEASASNAGVIIGGEQNFQLGDAAGTSARILGGNDSIVLANARIGAADSGYSVLQVYGELGFESGVPFAEQGHDRVRLSNVRFASSFSDALIDTGSGHDYLEVANCSFGTFQALLGDGNDLAAFTNTRFLSAHLDGGLGFDILFAQGNDGVLTHSNFERWRVTR